MAIIGNQVPPPSPLPPNFRRRVVVKFRPEAERAFARAEGDEIAQGAGAAGAELVAAFPGLTFEPYFANLGESTLRGFANRGSEAEGAGAAARFTSYFAVQPPGDTPPEEVAKAIAQLPDVEAAYVEGGPTPPPGRSARSAIAPPVDPSDDPRNPNQGYLDAAPAGIDARWAWSRVAGSGITFVDLEQGWDLAHEDLVRAGISIISGLDQDYPGYGTAVLGEVVGVDNTVGGVGIAPAVSARVVSQWRENGTYNTAEAILSAVDAMKAGDVLLLEAQTSYPTATGFVPVEVELAVFDAIQFATSQGIVVVEAGANGSVDLDEFQDLDGKQILNRGSRDFRDSGAILVGAASAAAPHERLGFSNFGSRVDCFAWGESIDTCGDGWQGRDPQAYTSFFGGTSGASPIVTGAALLVQSWNVAEGKERLSPKALRELLSDPSLNTASDPKADRIGVMPDLRAIIEGKKPEPEPELEFDPNRWKAVQWILFGVAEDGGGV
ncbi:MAG TPA: S8 family peptidase, partial [Thermoanaerobaculia bacterium]|nr:S8 family peptidase [Thermoanaerobaculia bacterium]